MSGFMAGVFDVLKTAEHNQNSAIRPEQETSQDSLFVLVLVTTARIFRSRMKRKFHVRFCIGGGVGNPPTDRNYLPVIRAHVSVSFGFSEGFCFLGDLSRLGLRLVACSISREPETGYSVPHIHFARL